MTADILNPDKVPTPEEIERAQQEAFAAEQNQVVSDLRDGSTAVGSSGEVNEQNAPRDPQPDQPQAQGQTQQEQTQEQTQGQPQQPRANNQEEPTPPEITEQQPLLKASHFEGKKASFLDPDTENGFWNAVDKNIDRAFQGNEPDEVAFNMIIAAITVWMDMAANYATHFRKERKRLQSAYKEAVADHDNKVMGVTAMHKNLAVWAALADHPGMRAVQGKPVGPETIKAAYRVLRTDKNAQKTVIGLVESMTGREFKDDEKKNVFKEAFAAAYGTSTLLDLKGRGLKDPTIKKAYDTVSLQQQIADRHARVRGHREQVRENRTNRRTYNSTRQQQAQQQTFANAHQQTR